MRFIILILFYGSISVAHQIRVAAIDTGFTRSSVDIGTKICPYGNWDFTDPKEIEPLAEGSYPMDHHGHGTHVAGLIHQGFMGSILSEKIDKDEAQKDLTANNGDDYCLIILKYVDPAFPSKNQVDSIYAEVAAIKWATLINVDIINLSGGGVEYFEEERNAINAALLQGITIIAAAGNNGSILTRSLSHSKRTWVKDKEIRYSPFYPASYSGVISVGSYGFDVTGKKTEVASSNKGPLVKVWELGEDVYSTLPHGMGYMTGTSQATAIYSGKLARKMHDIQIHVTNSTKTGE